MMKLVFWPLALVLLIRQAVPVPAAERSVTDAPYQAKADMKMLADATINSGSNTLSSETAAFAPFDAGKSIVIAGAGASGSVFSTTIGSVPDPHHATLRATVAST